MAEEQERYLVGLIGSGIATSLSPALHEREADRQGLRYLYQLVELRNGDVGELLLAARQLRFRGLNITHPAKQAVLPHLDVLAPEAAEIGAVNTVVFDGDRATGHNTDRYGFATGLARALPGVDLHHVVLLGAGGAGLAVAAALAEAGCRRITVADVDLGRAQRLAAALSRHAAVTVVPVTPEAVPGRLADAAGLVNATPIGMEGHHGSPIAAEHLRPDLWVADVIYRPLDTALIRAARVRGCRVADGGGMVVHQAAASFRLFTGHEPDAERMFADFLALTGGGNA
ncbi:shikimate dehydrogenase [Amorphoplanes nipponensis]|uniref:Shikimate dehydrogenase (NADP(+)) n=1 Tax=Actinoplanes nipponensis TaxID=135950 RepID=A0A919JCT1_9ACTN|nr:shikimate dehydrogenase [Actinoplanes nipponensis]GIE46995.1 shikimate dehydrogenase (NADP(+)) [Actinoplanes nipponensis]